MESRTEELKIVRIAEKERETKTDVVIREFPLTIFLNNQELVTLLCTPENLENLAVGFLFSEGILQNKEEVQKLTLDQEKGVAWVETTKDKDFVGKLRLKRLITSGCGKGATFHNVVDATTCKKVESKLKISSRQILHLVSDMQRQSKLYRATGGVHNAALADSKNILLFREDIGRHNAIDKILGECFLKGLSTDDKIMFTSGRVSSEILVKIAKSGVPMIVSISAPTNLAVKLAHKLNITLIGFARGKRLNIYTHDGRVTSYTAPIKLGKSSINVKCKSQNAK